MFKRLAGLFLPNLWDLPGIGQWALVFLPTVVTAISGAFGGVPIMWIIVGTTVAFAATFAGLVSFRVFKFQRDPQHKFRFVRPTVNRTPNGVIIGFEIGNEALFPIGVKIDELRTTCATRTTLPDRAMLNRQFELAPGDITFYNDAIIDIQNVTEQVMIGRLEASIKYGHPGKESFKIEKDLDIYIPLDPTRSINWTNHTP